MVTITLPIVIVPVRPGFPFFLETENLVVPEPIPEAPAVIVIQESLDLAVHGQPPLTETVIDPVPAVGGRVNRVGNAETIPLWKVPIMA